MTKGNMIDYVSEKTIMETRCGGIHECNAKSMTQSAKKFIKSVKIIG